MTRIRWPAKRPMARSCAFLPALRLAEWRKAPLCRPVRPAGIRMTLFRGQFGVSNREIRNFSPIPVRDVGDEGRQIVRGFAARIVRAGKPLASARQSLSHPFVASCEVPFRELTHISTVTGRSGKRCAR
jgi:hypothetical protein